MGSEISAILVFMGSGTRVLPLKSRSLDSMTMNLQGPGIKIDVILGSHRWSKWSDIAHHV